MFKCPRGFFYNKMFLKFTGVWLTKTLFFGFAKLPAHTELRPSWGGYPSPRLDTLAQEIIAEYKRIE